MGEFTFSIQAEDGGVRLGQLETPHGAVATPCFMPVGTHGAVKGVTPTELRAIGTQVVLGNTYHLHLRPGEGTIANLGGLHAVTQWNGPLLTDSGGYQVFSLGERSGSGGKKAPLRKVTEEGITFTSHRDGSQQLLTPESVMEIERFLGADIAMPLDQPVYGLASETEANGAMQRTHRWLDRAVINWEANGKRTAQGLPQALFGIVQGGVHTTLHRESAAYVREKGLPGNAIGGLSVGEGKADMWEALASITALLPENRPRYFMGLGEPLDLIEAAVRGVDMADCVAPSRLARHGVAWQFTGSEAIKAAFWAGDTENLIEQGRGGDRLVLERWNLHNARFAADTRTMPSPVDSFPLGALSHYIREGEMVGFRVLTLHNIALLHRVTEHLREAVRRQRVAALAQVFSLRAQL